MNPEDIFEVHGYYEQLMVRNGDRWKMIGTRRIEKPTNRKLGVEGKQSYTFNQSIQIQKVHREVSIKASPKNPIVCEGIAQAICGRMK